MRTPQQPIGSGFGYRSTAVEVIDGIDLSGKLAIVTGGYSGLGLETVGARVVALSSRGHKRSGIRFDDLMFEHGYDRWEAYGQAKSANCLFAVQLDELGRSSGVRAFAVHPGPILTPLQRYLSPDFLREA